MRDAIPSDRSRVRRAPHRAHYDRATIDAILDDGILCHVGYVFQGAAFVIPTLYWREGDRVFWHGSSASRMLRADEGTDVCLTVSHLDGLVLARSGFHSSVNYRSVMLLGKAERVGDEREKLLRFEQFLEQLCPGRWPELRPPTAQELRATSLLSLPICEASAKVRVGPPLDDEDDYALPIWAGVIPIRTVWDPPQPDPRLLRGIPLPDHVQRLLEVDHAG